MKSRKGSVLLYVLVFYLFFLSWFHIQLQSFKDSTLSKIYLKEIDAQLSLETLAIRFLNNTWPDVPKTHTIENSTIHYDCEDHQCHVSITGTITYDFIYAIIEE